MSFQETAVMNPTDPINPTTDPIVAPTRLTANHRLEFRRVALEALEQAVRVGAKTIEVDLGGTLDLDASGLGVLVLLQKRAREQGIATRLLQISRTTHQMLTQTRLDHLFEYTSRA